MHEGQGYFYDALDCQTFWTHSDSAGDYCSDSTKMDRACVTNYSKFIPGDLTAFDASLLDDFLTKDSTTPFLAYIALSTNHVPHYALPEFYYAYNDTLGNVAGDYLGSITQMDHGLGILRSVLQKHDVEENTMVWFSTDNGPHTIADKASLNPLASARSGGQLAATNGLRQCKASVFEGGIRVPGFIVWPALLGKSHGRSSHLSSSLDFMATVTDILGLSYPQPTWALDSKSLLPILNGSAPLNSRRNKVLGWQYGEQEAVTNQTDAHTWKIVRKPAVGQCSDMLPPFKNGEAGPLLFDLDSDPTESNDLCASEPTVCSAMDELMTQYLNGVTASALHESGCEIQ